MLETDQKSNKNFSSNGCIYARRARKTPYMIMRVTDN